MNDVKTRAWDIAAAVPDPEMPIVSIGDLGILRDVTENDTGCVHVQITPTYSGCPAVETIRDDLVEALTCAGYRRVDVELVLAPAWSTDWITPRGLARLEAHGVAPPARLPGRAAGPVAVAISVRCPQCGSPDTREASRFGSTACKALRVCRACAEPFDHLKPI